MLIKTLASLAVALYFLWVVPTYAQPRQTASAPNAQLVPPVGTDCISTYSVVGDSTYYGTLIMRFEAGGLHRYGRKGKVQFMVKKTDPILLRNYPDLKTAPVEVGTFNFDGKTWSLKSQDSVLIWYGNWNPITHGLQSAEYVPSLTRTVRVNDIESCDNTPQLLGP